MLVFLEGLVLCFILLLICVIGIANGPVGLVIFYEQDVKDRVVELGLTTKEKIRKTNLIASAALFIPNLFLVPAVVYGINGAREYGDLFWQMSIIFWIEGLFDRFFIDWYWVEHTNAWLIPGTEDLMPYIPKKTLLMKWVSTVFAYPAYAGIAAGLIRLLLVK